MTATPRTPRSVGHIIVALLFGLLTLNAAREAISSDGPRALRAFQTVVAASAAVTAWGAWRVTRWASLAAVIYGMLAATMIASLVRMLGLPSDAQRGLWTGASMVLVFSLVCAWYLHHARTRANVERTEIT
jgi:hypothetical protein